MNTLSAAMEDYLKTIYHLREEGAGDVSTQNVATRLGVAAPSATAMIKKLATLELVNHEPYRGVELTDSGERVALEIIRHHRLSEAFLTQILGLDWDKAHAEADRWEHVLSEEVEAKMAELLGDPTHDPHGAPIPTLDGKIAEFGGELLSELATGKRGKVCRVSDEDAPLLRHLAEVGLVPGARVEVLRAESIEGVLKLRIDERDCVLGMVPARNVWVEVGA